jgi:hypothetical protein
MAVSELESLRNLAAALFRLERSRGPEDVDRVLSALISWLSGPEQTGLRRAFTTWLVQVLLPARLPGQGIPEGLEELKEVKSMLAERVKEWTKEWKQQGFAEGHQEGLQEGLERARGVLLNELEKRFGLLDEDVRRQVSSINSFEELMKLTLRVGSASSVAALGLTTHS